MLLVNALLLCTYASNIPAKEQPPRREYKDVATWPHQWPQSPRGSARLMHPKGSQSKPYAAVTNRHMSSYNAGSTGISLRDHTGGHSHPRAAQG